jgi:hypothetical protein
MSKLETNQVDPATGTTLTLGTSGDTITIPSGVTIANSGTATGFGANTPAFQGYYGAASYQTVSDNTATKLTIDTEEFDTSSAFDTSTSRFTIPSGQAGKYFIFGKFFTYSSNDTGRQGKIYIYKNGSVIDQTENQYRLTQDSIVGSALYTSYISDASASDYFEIYGIFNVDSGTDNRLYRGAFGAYKIIT